MKLRLDTGEAAVALRFDGTFLTLRSPRAYAPGSPIRFTTCSDHGDRRMEGRALGSKRVDDAQFEVRIRFVNLRRADRGLLQDTLSP